MSKGPARGYSWPPFEKGHQLSVGNRGPVKHGAWSPRKIAPIAQQYLDGILTDPDVAYLRAPAYRPALEAWAAAEARLCLVERWVSDLIAEHGMDRAAESGQGRTSPLELLRRYDAAAWTARGRLGLDPLSRARLGRDVAATQVDVVMLLTEERERLDRERQEREQGVVDVDAD